MIIHETCEVFMKVPDVLIGFDVSIGPFLCLFQKLRLLPCVVVCPCFEKATVHILGETSLAAKNKAEERPEA
jgi:hypothetical protein